mmetsp:Transcript_5439/g.20511  ORF Transcript_5439/g.20511 Transcript_5439/m.20511 type:complete len:274 (+) Transcript_5439:961-1782(+)
MAVRTAPPPKSQSFSSSMMRLIRSSACSESDSMRASLFSPSSLRANTSTSVALSSIPFRRLTSFSLAAVALRAVSTSRCIRCISCSDSTSLRCSADARSSATATSSSARDRSASPPGPFRTACRSACDRSIRALMSSPGTLENAYVPVITSLSFSLHASKLLSRLAYFSICARFQNPSSATAFSSARDSSAAERKRSSHTSSFRISSMCNAEFSFKALPFSLRITSILDDHDSMSCCCFVTRIFSERYEFVASTRSSTSFSARGADLVSSSPS